MKLRRTGTFCLYIPSRQEYTLPKDATQYLKKQTIMNLLNSLYSMNPPHLLDLIDLLDLLDLNDKLNLGNQQIQQKQLN